MDTSRAMQHVDLGRNRRGDMAVGMKDLKAYASDWVLAGDQIAMHWDVWEEWAARQLNAESANSEIMHHVMRVVVAICRGTVADVKRTLREASPSTIAMCRVLFAHLHQFVTVIDAEHSFRQHQLEEDWKLIPGPPGQLTVRMVYRRSGSAEEH